MLVYKTKSVDVCTESDSLAATRPQADSHNGTILEAIFTVHKIVLQRVRLCESCVRTLAATRALCVSCSAATPHPRRSPNVSRRKSRWVISIV